MDEVLKQFSDIIAWYDEDIRDDGKKAHYWAKIKFIDNSKLQAYERLDKLSDKYSYQWMKEDNTLIIRWDNAKHHIKVETYPDHKHVDTNQNVHASEPMS